MEFTTLNRRQNIKNLMKAPTPGFVFGTTLETVYTTKFQTVCRKSESWRSPRKFLDHMDRPGSPRIRSVRLIHTERPTEYASSTSLRHPSGEFRTYPASTSGSWAHQHRDLADIRSP